MAMAQRNLIRQWDDALARLDMLPFGSMERLRFEEHIERNVWPRIRRIHEWQKTKPMKRPATKKPPMNNTIMTAMKSMKAMKVKAMKKKGARKQKK